MTIGVLGATGYTGILIVDYLVRHADGHAWLMGGRSEEKLAAVRRRQNVPDTVRSVIVDVSDAQSLDSFLKQCSVVVNCVGPYRFYGQKVVESALRTGTAYIDLNGEPEFIAKMSRDFHDEAVQKNIPIVMAAGFDSVPADIGTRFATEPFDKDHPLRVRASVFFHGHEDTLSSGSVLPNVSHGTFNTLLESIRGGVPSRKYYKKPEQGQGQGQGHQGGQESKLSSGPPVYFDTFRSRWLVKFPVADVHIVRRTCDVLGRKNLRYEHYLELTSLFALLRFFLTFVVLTALALLGPTYRLLKRYKKEGEGPSAEQRNRIRFTMTLDATGQMSAAASSENPTSPPTSTAATTATMTTTTTYTTVSGPEPYVATAIAVVEAAKMVHDSVAASSTAADLLQRRGGVITPGSCLNVARYVDRLEAHGIHFARV